MRGTAFSVLIVSGLVTAQLCGAATENTDEVLVRGTRLKGLKAAIIEAENRFYARYNELNKVDDYDIDCSKNAHTGSRVAQRHCFTKLQTQAMAQHAREVVEMFQQHPKPLDIMPGQSQTDFPAGMTATARPPNTDPVAVWLSRFDDYRDNMLYLLKMNPDLRRLAREREEAEARYDAEYKRRLKGRLVHWE
jgi:hypothetical protein